ncbi:DUF4192 domain-containing protein [Microbacterium sp. STN6]|uniref:DUF4192 domain-containing protein n=1 Tax=Microbacterium sp. STN6 TaxID=2995588 RepID=UPI002260FBD9|nr:DUF4192 domain-containing protein [Microbacterium sp. STN6]MCX7521186.1 DUF4192 domain-containing protein [Microbacterium sp. STN6]
MDTLVKVDGLAQFLAAVPHMVGFEPENSVVLVALRGKRTCGALRFNLPASTNRTVVKRIVTTIIGVFCRLHGVDAVVPVVYTQQRFADSGHAPHREVADELIRRAELSGFTVRDAACVASDGWGSYYDSDCPSSGRPLSLITTSGLQQRLPAEHTVAASAQQLARIEPADASTRRRVEGALNRIEGPIPPNALVDLTEQVLSWQAASLTPDQAATLLAAIQPPSARDQAMLQFAFGPDAGRLSASADARARVAMCESGGSMDDVVAASLANPSLQHADDVLLASMMMGSSPRRPDVERVERAIELLKAACGMAPAPGLLPAPLTMLAWLSWALGLGSCAGEFLDRVRAIDSRYGMAEVLGMVIDGGTLPEWAFADGSGGDS